MDQKGPKFQLLARNMWLLPMSHVFCFRKWYYRFRRILWRKKCSSNWPPDCLLPYKGKKFSDFSVFRPKNLAFAHAACFFYSSKSYYRFRRIFGWKFLVKLTPGPPFLAHDGLKIRSRRRFGLLSIEMSRFNNSTDWKCVQCTYCKCFQTFHFLSGSGGVGIRSWSSNHWICLLGSSNMCISDLDPPRALETILQLQACCTFSAQFQTIMAIIYWNGWIKE